MDCFVAIALYRMTCTSGAAAPAIVGVRNIFEIACDAKSKMLPNNCNQSMSNCVASDSVAHRLDIISAGCNLDKKVFYVCDFCAESSAVAHERWRNGERCGSMEREGGKGKEACEYPQDFYCALFSRMFRVARFP